MINFTKYAFKVKREVRKALSQKITLSSAHRLDLESFITTVKRKHIANFLGILLTVLTISVAIAGFFTYNNLDAIVSRLETDEAANSNLYQYKEILVNLQQMENQVELYDLTANDDYLDNYNETITTVFQNVDSINRLNEKDQTILLLNDSLADLINQKTELLNQFIALRDSSDKSELEKLEGYLSNLELEKDQINNDSNLEPDSENESTEKTGFFKKLFAKKPKNTSVSNVENTEHLNARDSTLSAEKKAFQNKINSTVKRIKQAQDSAKSNQRSQEIQLLGAHFDIQNRIMDLVTYLEKIETIKMKKRSMEAKLLTAETSQQVTLFFFLATLLLLSSVIVMIVYVKRSLSYQEILRESKKNTEELSHAKERFFANMSHEIRTPMNAISGFTKILLKSNLNPEQKDQMEIINQSSDHLLHLLNDILDFSKLQANKLQLEETDFSLDQVAKETIELLRESAVSKGISLKIETNSLPKLVKGDPYRLRQILLNLLNNGIKFTEKGTVLLKMTGTKTSGWCDIEIEVSDTGIGMTPAQQKKIFEEFEQASQSSSSKGTGLGLAITKGLVMLHKGQINLNSQPNEGTKVSIKLTYPISDTATIEPSQRQNTTQFQGIHVLIADDEPFNIKLLATLLKNRGFTYKEATDGNAALQLAKVESFDLILLDLKMPGLSGWEVASQLKNNNGPNQRTPKIALTATITKLDHQKGEEVGFDRLMRKPFDENELFETIQKLVDIPIKTTPQIDISSLRNMGDDQFVTDMIETFIQSARSGMKEIYKAYEQNDFDEIGLIAHKIVAPARHFKADRLVGQLKSLEQKAEAKDQIQQTELDTIKKLLSEVIESLQNEITQLTQTD